MRIFKYLVYILLLLAISAIVLSYSQFSGPQREGKEERFVITLNTPEEEVVDNLKEEGFLRNKTFFNFILAFKGWQGKIKPGAYKISKT